MDQNEDLAKEAIKYIELAQKFESEKDFDKAIYNYQLAVESLNKSGYMIEGIKDIYTKIEDLKKEKQIDKVYQHRQIKAQIDQLQDQAFTLVDNAQKMERENRIDEAIDQYNSAIKLLIQAGWTDFQLESIREKVVELSRKPKMRAMEDRSQEEAVIPSMSPIEGESDLQVLDAFGVKKSAKKAEEIKKFKEHKQREDQIQQDAFAFIDNAKFYEESKEFEKAIANYQSAIELLNSIGWQEQTRNLNFLIEKLKRDKLEHERALQQGTYEKVQIIEPTIDSKQVKKESVRTVEQEALKNKSETIQSEAFNLIDLGKKFDREKQYEKAIDSFQKAIDLFRSIELDAYIQPIINFINDVKDKQKSEKELSIITKKREGELKSLQDSIFIKQREDFIQATRDIEKKRRDYEREKQEVKKKEDAFFSKLEEADKILKAGKDLEAAIVKYEDALESLKNLGSGWESYLDILTSTIATIKNLKEEQINRLKSIQKSKEQKQQADLEFQEYISKELEKERVKIKQRELDLEARRDELEYREERKNEGFKALEHAQEFINKKDYDNAILAYQSAGTIFAGIQWDEELHLIESAIGELEERKKKDIELKQSELQKSIDKQKADMQFQEQISEQLKEEREKLLQSEIMIREREEELRYRETLKVEAFKILEVAQLDLEKGFYDKAIEQYQSAMDIFAKIQWYDEVELIGKSILEIRNKRRDAELKKQRDLQSLLKKEQEETEFHQKIINEMKLQKDKLQQKQLILREREKELEFRTQRKEEAFKIIDEAQNYLSLGKFDLAIESYRSVADIFAQIQWEDELSLITQAIRDIELKKKEKELWKQKSVEEAIERETAYKKFIDSIKYQREIEKKKIENEKELIQQKKQLTEEKVKRQGQILSEIESADELINQEKYDEAITIYEKGIKEMQELGWTESYLKLLEETLRSIVVRKKEKENEIQRQRLLLQQQQQEEERFYIKIEEQMLREQKRLEHKAIEIQEKEKAKERMEKSRSQAFELMDQAEILVTRGDYDQAIEVYRQAEQVLSEIRYPTDAIREMIQKIQEKKREKALEEHKELERSIQKEKEEEDFKKQIAEKIRLDEEKMRLKEIEIQQQAIRTIELDEAKNEAFKLLEEAEHLTNSGNYNQALETYHKAELKLSELQFPTEVIREMKFKIQQKIKQEEISKQKDLEKVLEREKEEKEYQQHMNELITREKQRLRAKDLDLIEKAKKKKEIEIKRDDVFKVLEDAQEKLKDRDYSGAIELYQTAISTFKEIGWNDEISLLQTSIREIQLRRRGYQAYIENEKQKEVEREEEEKQFNEELTRQLRRERERFNLQKLRVREYKNELDYRELRRDEAFSLLDEARTQLNEGYYENAIELYYEVEKIFAEIQWDDEIQLIHNSILDIQNRRTEAQIARQKEIEENLKQEKEDLAFQYLLIHLSKTEKENLEQKEIEVKEKEKELEYIESRRQEAFNQLDIAQNLISKGNLDEAQHYYYNVINVFAEIQWNDEIPLIEQAVRELDNRKREADFLKQKKLEQTLEEEKAKNEYIQRLKRLREDETRKLKQEQEKIEKVKEVSVKTKQGQEQAFEIIEQAENLLDQEKFDEALEEYKKAITILKEIGWRESYLKLLEDTTLEISSRKVEKERRIAKEKEARRKQIEEEHEFERKLAEQMENERTRLLEKEFKIKQQEELKQTLVSRKNEAFNLLDRAEVYLSQGLYDEASETYFQAELILNEIEFPTDSIKEMMQSIKQKRRDDEAVRQHENKAKLKQQEDEALFYKRIAESMRIEEKRMKAKQIRVKKQEELRNYLKQRKEDAFDLLDQAEILVKNANYDRALEFYRSAELILNEIQYPVDSLKETILKIDEKKREQEIQQQQELENKIQREREEKAFQQRIIEGLVNEKEKIRSKQVKVEKLKKLHELVEQKKEDAFLILEKAEDFTKKADYDRAIEHYRKAMLILNEIQYPTDSIDSMITKVSRLKRQKELDQELALQRELKRLEEEQQLQYIVDERKRQEQEKLAAQQLAVKQKEKLVEQQMTVREAAYALLEEGGRYLKRRIPDYDKAISLYIQAKDLLSEKIGWEPEINNLTQLIKDLTKEKESFLYKKKLEEDLRLQRQKEYEAFQQEIRNKRLAYEQQQKEQKRRLVQLYENQQYIEQKREEGLKLIDTAKEDIEHRNFKKAYGNFNQAIKAFKEIGWDDQAKYIQNEIENTKQFEQRHLQEQERVRKIHQELENRKKAEKQRKQEEELKLKEQVEEVGGLTSEISQLISEKRKEEDIKRRKEKEKVRAEAKSFKEEMKEMLGLKQKIMDQIKQSKKVESLKEEKVQISKDKEKVDEIKDMLKKVTKKEKDK